MAFWRIDPPLSPGVYRRFGASLSAAGVSRPTRKKVRHPPADALHIPADALYIMDARGFRAARITPKNRSEEHKSQLHSPRYLHSFPTRRSSDLKKVRHPPADALHIPADALHIMDARGFRAARIPANIPSISAPAWLVSIGSVAGVPGVSARVSLKVSGAES